MSEEKTARKRKPRPRPVRAVSFSVYSANGEPLTEETVKRVEEAMEKVTFELFNEGIRLLNSTARG